MSQPRGRLQKIFWQQIRRARIGAASFFVTSLTVSRTTTKVVHQDVEATSVCVTSLTVSRTTTKVVRPDVEATSGFVTSLSVSRTTTEVVHQDVVRRPLLVWPEPNATAASAAQLRSHIILMIEAATKFLMLPVPVASAPVEIPSWGPPVITSHRHASHARISRSKSEQVRVKKVLDRVV